ncbi:hypothetical protein [Spirosoma linguale]|uniref:Uncharacterized protein n=1 Tax=Spirosoma linguale (strain ATCC 33905 / DSM 74 / LMG 10896 / Claus 1) TaxID=504472 RepID=D2QV18_SPILD|nr:hypothetical protein Slin_6694 [Spirosoma linguale DSM 74]
MDAEQQMNMPGRYVEQEEYNRLMSDLIDRINEPSEEVRLSKLDKLTLSYGLRLLQLELNQISGLVSE